MQELSTNQLHSNHTVDELTGTASQLGCQQMQRWDQLSNSGANPCKKQRKLNFSSQGIMLMKKHVTHLPTPPTEEKKCRTYFKQLIMCNKILIQLIYKDITNHTVQIKYTNTQLKNHTDWLGTSKSKAHLVVHQQRPIHKPSCQENLEINKQFNERIETHISKISTNCK